MRLPLRHPPPTADPALRSCAHLEALLDEAVGLPLGPAARHTAARGGRGRHGQALQWHLGLAVRDSASERDWEGRIEIKMVSIGLRSDGTVGCDKLKVCEIGVDPWTKLANVAFVFVDRMTRVVLGHRFFRLAGAPLQRLARSWECDPDFDHPDLLVESRDAADGSSSPAYYLASRWFEREGLLPSRGPLPFDAAAWTKLRADYGRRDPLFAIRDDRRPQQCPRCSATLSLVDEERLRRDGWTTAHHGLPAGDPCGLRGHIVIAGDRLPRPRACSRAEQRAGVEARVPARELFRLADRVSEPEDHRH